MEENNGSSELLPQVVESGISTNIKELFEKGISYYNYGDINSALETFSSIIETNPKFPEAHVNLGNAYFKLNQINEAMNCWKKALSLDSTQAICYVNIGNAYFSGGNIEEAISHWLIAVTMAPDHTTALMNLGAAYEKLGDLSAAFKYYELYLKYCSKDNTMEYKRIFIKVSQLKQIALHNLKVGVYFQKKGNLRKATMAYLKSIESYPNFPKAHLNMGSICYMSDKLDHAIKYWSQALKLDDAHENTYCNLGVAYDRLKQYDNAYCLYKRYLNVIKQSTGDSNSIKARMEQIKKYLDKHPEIIRTHLDKAEEFYRKRKFSEALWEYENYLILSPESAGSYELKVSEIKDMLNPAKKASKMAYEIGNTCFGKKKYDKALQAYKRYLHFEPKGEYSDIAFQKITECGRLIKGASRSLAVK